MHPPSVWDFSDYKTYLHQWILSRPHAGHGSKAALARAAKCQTAYISQVLSGPAHLSLEQGELIAEHLGLTEEETHVFLLLIQRGRAGTAKLQNYFSRQLAGLIAQRNQLKNRVDKGAELAPADQSAYFSSWVHAAVHLLVRIPGYPGAASIARRLGLPVRTAEDSLKFLEAAGLVERKRALFIASNARMHLPHDSSLVGRHHVNWRIRAMQAVDRASLDDLHYSSVVTLSAEDANRLRKDFLRAIEAAKKIIADSQDERLFSFCLDFFEV